MGNVGFDDKDYSVVVKNRGAPPNPWKWEIYRAGRSNPIGRSATSFAPWWLQTRPEKRRSSSYWLS